MHLDFEDISKLHLIALYCYGLNINKKLQGILSMT